MNLPPIESLPAQLVSCGSDANPCDLCDFVLMIDNIVGFIVGISVVLFILVLTYAGFALVTSGGNTGTLDRAKRLFTNGIVGLIIITASWFIIDTVLKLSTGDQLGVWNSFEGNCGEEREAGEVDKLALESSEEEFDVPDTVLEDTIEIIDQSGSRTTITSRKKNSGTPIVTSTPSNPTTTGSPGNPTVTGTPNNYSSSVRGGLVRQIIANGDGAFGTTELTINGQCTEVMNDSPTLPDGTYVPFTHPEATQMANQWGWRIPTSNQVLGIRAYTEAKGKVYPGITRTNVTVADRENSIQALLNDPEMSIRARHGRSELINGHFKWYVQENGLMQIMGLSKGNGTYWQPLSAAHSFDRTYVDYSHGVRLVRPCQ